MKTGTLYREARKTLFNGEQNTEDAITICTMKDTGALLTDSFCQECSLGFLVCNTIDSAVVIV